LQDRAEQLEATLAEVLQGKTDRARQDPQWAALQAAWKQARQTLDSLRDDPTTATNSEGIAT